MWRYTTSMNPFDISSFLPVHIPSYLVWGLFVFGFLAYGIVTVVMIYHWQRYGRGAGAVALAESVYLIVSVALLIIAISSTALI